MKNLFYFIFSLSLFSVSWGLYCYKCVGSHPGCGLYDFDWRYYWSHSCPEENDKCVKVIEKKGAEVMVIRDCLSNLEGHRRDIPADRYEGCRPAAKDPLVAHYIFPSVKEIDHKREHYSNTTYCFCNFDERCNGSSGMTSNSILLGLLIVCHLAATWLRTN